jgi:hypothetical protein
MKHRRALFPINSSLLAIFSGLSIELSRRLSFLVGWTMSIFTLNGLKWAVEVGLLESLTEMLGIELCIAPARQKHCADDYVRRGIVLISLPILSLFPTRCVRLVHVDLVVGCLNG